jgi:hypothetical protein
MNLEQILVSILRIETAITEIYSRLSSLFEDDERLESFWDEMYQRRREHVRLLERCQAMTAFSNDDRQPGREIPYQDLLNQIAEYEVEIREKQPGVDRAFRIAFHLESLSIRSVFNEMIKLPKEPFFQVLSEIHLGVRRNMGCLIRGIETFCSDPELLFRVYEIKEKVVERRSGDERRAGRSEFPGRNRRQEDRRKGDLVKIIWH